MAREGLRGALTEALHKATRTTESVHGRAPRVRTNGHFTTVDVTIGLATVDPATAPDARLYLVVLEDAPDARPEPAPPGTAGNRREPPGRRPTPPRTAKRGSRRSCGKWGTRTSTSRA